MLGPSRIEGEGTAEVVRTDASGAGAEGGPHHRQPKTKQLRTVHCATSPEEGRLLGRLLWEPQLAPRLVLLPTGLPALLAYRRRRGDLVVRTLLCLL